MSGLPIHTYFLLVRLCVYSFSVSAENDISPHEALIKPHVEADFPEPEAAFILYKAYFGQASGEYLSKI